jgi:hypothetical protein
MNRAVYIGLPIGSPISPSRMTYRLMFGGHGCNRYISQNRSKSMD